MKIRQILESTQFTSLLVITRLVKLSSMALLDISCCNEVESQETLS